LIRLSSTQPIDRMTELLEDALWSPTWLAVATCEQCQDSTQGAANPCAGFYSRVRTQEQIGFFAAV
jgi:hypothetical protein